MRRGVSDPMETKMRLYFAVAIVTMLAFYSTRVCSKIYRSTAEMRFARIAQSPPDLRSFLYAMPKGADLHYHLTGGAYAENIIRMEAARDSCINQDTLNLIQQRCDGTQKLRPISEAHRDPDLNRKIVDAWSMRGFVPSEGLSGHDHFSKSFKLFGSGLARAGLVAEVTNRAAMQHLTYMELMVSLQAQAVRQIASRIHWVDDFDSMREKLIEGGLDQVVDDAVTDLNQIESTKGSIQDCAGRNPELGCGVEIRYLIQTIRSAPPEVVFAQTLFGFLLARKDSRVVGINLVGAEEHPISLANYSLHMQMLHYLRTRMPEIKVALHAGELTLGLVPPEELRSHVREAVETGGAARIGHGTDIMYEDRPYQLLRELADRRIAIEVALTSNRVNLGVSGSQHPIAVYRRLNVPVVLATDDEGVLRTDMTNELVTAVISFGLKYVDVVSLQRNSLEFSFLPGQSLWEETKTWRRVPACRQDPIEKLSPACSEFLKFNKKAEIQFRFERALKIFESDAESLN
jgi:adenosine deaminase